MNNLFLYVDNHYIAAAIRDDNDVMKPVLPKTEDEFYSLFFFEDTDHNRISYGEANKPNYYKKVPHYYGGIFRLIADNSKTFTLFDRKQTFDKVFKESGILREWKDAVGEDRDASRGEQVNGFSNLFGIFGNRGNTVEKDRGPRGDRQVATYISFAADVDYASRNVFVDNILSQEGFNVRERSVPIEHLALEHALRLKRVKKEGCYLVLNAYNEQLHFSLYRHQKKSFVRLGENTLPGMGTDPRARALVEDVVDKINNVQHFLTTPEEKEKEYCNLGQYTDQWLRQLNVVQGGRPLQLLDVRLSVVPNVYSVAVTAGEINGRTKKIVADVVNEVNNFVAKTLPSGENICSILFLGDGFVNEQFNLTLARSYRLEKEDFVHFRRSDLPAIVSVYRQINLNQFSAESQKHKHRGEQELIALRNAQAEAERVREARRQAEEKALAEAAARKGKEAYFKAMDEVDEHERKKEWAQMLEAAKAALELLPEDQHAKEKLQRATQLLAEAKVRNEQYQQTLTQAQAAQARGDWQDALSHAKAALNVFPDSKVAKQLYEQLAQKIEQLAHIREHFATATAFEQQGNYRKALEELEKVQRIDRNHPDLQPRMSTCRLKISERERKIFAMKEEYTRATGRNEHVKAAECARRLAAFLDPEQQSEWIAREEQHKRAAEAEQKQKEFIDDCTKHYNKAWFDEDWATFVRYAEEVLRCRKDDELAERVERAKIRVRAERDRRQFEEALERVKVLIADRNYEEARRLLNALKADATTPQQQEIVTRLFKLIFEKEDQNNGSSAGPTQQQGRMARHFKRIFEEADQNNGFAAITLPEKGIVARLFKRISEEADQNNGFFAGPTQQPAGQLQQGKDQSPQPAGQSSGIDDPEGFFGKREAPKPAARPKKADAETKPTPDNKQKKGAKNETNKGYSLDEFNF